MFLHEFQISAFLGRRLRPHDFQQRLFFRSSPFIQLLDEREGDREIAESSERCSSPIAYAEAQQVRQIPNGSGEEFLRVPIKLRRHVTLNSQTNLSNLKPIPIARLCFARGFVELENHWTGGKLAKCSQGRAIARSRCMLLFFIDNELHDVAVRRAKSEFTIKPERSRLDAFLVFISDLIGINRKGGYD